MSKQYPQGTLIPIGGNEDKGIEESENYTLEFIEDGILAHVVSQSGGVGADIVIIPTASSIPVEVSEMYTKSFQKLGCNNIHILDIRSRQKSDSPETLNLIRKANCVLFSGGDQSRITEYIKDTKMHDILVDRYLNEQFVIAGTSAGAMCMSGEMIAGGSDPNSFRKGVVIMSKGLNLASEFIIDSHFIKRGRFGRLTEAVAHFPDLIGIGLAEDTGLIIKDGSAQVIGSGMVIIFDAREAEHNNAQILEESTPMTLTNMKTHVLSNGDIFSIESRKIDVLAIEMPFI